MSMDVQQVPLENRVRCFLQIFKFPNEIQKNTKCLETTKVFLNVNFKKIVSNFIFFPTVYSNTTLTWKERCKLKFLLCSVVVSNPPSRQKSWEKYFHTKKNICLCIKFSFSHKLKILLEKCLSFLLCYFSNTIGKSLLWLETISEVIKSVTWVFFQQKTFSKIFFFSAKFVQNCKK